MLDKKSHVKTVLEQVIRKTLELPSDKVVVDDNIFVLLEVDSLAALEVLVCVEKEFKIQIPDEDLNVALLSSLEKMTDYILDKTSVATPAATE